MGAFVIDNGGLVSCTLCGRDGPGTYIGLAVMDIVYQGERKQLCDDCIKKIARWQGDVTRMDQIHTLMDENEWNADLWDGVADVVLRSGRPAFKLDADEVDDSYRIQEQEMRAETFAAERMMGMRPGTTEGWYDEPEPPDPEDAYLDMEMEDRLGGGLADNDLEGER